MKLTPQKKTSSPRYPSRLFIRVKRTSRMLATAVMASAALLMVACPGAMVQPSDPTAIEPQENDFDGGNDVEPESELEQDLGDEQNGAAAEEKTDWKLELASPAPDLLIEKYVVEVDWL